MKRAFRIIRIWYFGKLPYGKRVNKWMRGRLFRDLYAVGQEYVEKYKERYGNLALGQYYENNKPPQAPPPTKKKFILPSWRGTIMC